MNDGYKGTDFEWWYFQFISDVRFNLIIHPTDMYGLKKVSYISVSILEMSGRGINFRQIFDFEKAKISKSKLSIKSDIFYVEESEKGIFINLFWKDVKAKIEISKIVIPEPFSEKSKLFSKDGKLDNNWMLVVPYSIFCGILQYLDKNIQLGGHAYHAHNWGDLLIYKCCDYWL